MNQPNQNCDEINGGVLLPMMPTRGGGMQATLAVALED